MFNTTSCVADAVLHHVWQRRLPSCEFKSYQRLLEEVTFTPRTWNSNVQLNRVLKHISFKLGLDINIIGIKRWKNNSNTLGNCQLHINQWCDIPFYKFQNSLTKLLFPVSNNFCQINLFFYKQKYYVLTAIDHLKPFLIDRLPTTTITFNNTTIYPQDILSILKNPLSPNPYPFSVAVYTAFSFVKVKWTKQIKANLIGYNTSPEHTNIAYLFITPYFLTNSFSITVLDTFTDDVTQFNKKNIFCNPHITEGQPNKRGKEPLNQELLNQNHCVCEHPDTSQFLVPEEKLFRPLGKYYTTY